jgi:glycosyltransferase involved in cell wall biosynthesis
MTRALHAPWNEGTRVIARDLSHLAGLLRTTHILSVTNQRFSQGEDDSRVTHVFTGANYGLASDYVSLPRVIRCVNQLLRDYPIDVAHLLELPLVIAPFLHARGIHVIRHITLFEHSYKSVTDRVRGTFGWRLFDHWVDRYAISSTALVEPLLSMGADPSKLSVIPTPVDTTCYRPIEPASARNRLKLEHDSVVVVYIGTLSPVRFPLQTIRHALCQAGKDLGRDVLFFAFAPNVTHLYNRHWSTEVQAQLQGIPNIDVRVEVRDLSSWDKIDWYSAADVLLIPFSGPVAVEPPLTLLEAMACETLVLVSPQANRSGLVQNGVNGLMFADEKSLVEQLGYVLGRRSREDLQSIRKAARLTIMNKNSFQAAMSALKGLWQGLQ